ncbi:MAG: ABC transporter substrate-binding protein [Actinobacteria bacterium]|nr:ABC transporter substrate-binding protein [Actinomycetota bacterium]
MSTVDVETGPAALPLMQSGQLAGVADVGEPPIAIGFARNIPLKVVWSGNVTPVTLVVNKDIKSAADLAGKKIAAPGGSTGEIFLKEYLAENNVAWNEIEYVDLGGPDIVPAYSSGAIDGAFIWVPQSLALLHAGGHELTTQPGSQVTIFSQEFIDQHPDVVQAFVCDMAQIQETALKTPNSVWAALAEKLKLPESELPELMPKDTIVPVAQMGSPKYLGPNGAFAQQVVATGEILAEEGAIPQAPTISEVNEMIDLQFAEAVTAGKCS